MTIKKYKADEYYVYDSDDESTEVEASADHTQYNSLVITLKDTIHTDNIWKFESVITTLLDPYFLYGRSKKNNDDPYYEGEIEKFTMYFSCK